MPKASDAIKLLQEQIRLHGDLPLSLHGRYGASEECFEILEDQNLPKEEIKNRSHIHIWTGINTG